MKGISILECNAELNSEERLKILSGCKKRKEEEEEEVIDQHPDRFHYESKGEKRWTLDKHAICPA